jgi:hypothetical protein
MKKLIFVFMGLLCATSSLSYGAVSVKSSGVKKAAPVATKQTDKLESATSLLPTVIGLVSSAKALSVQQQQLTADCAPTSSEIETVNNLVKEWAKTGNTVASTAVAGLGVPCSGNEEKNSSGHYVWYMKTAEKNDACYESFTSNADEDMIWKKFPKASSGDVCDVIDEKNCKKVSNIYDVFARIPFTEEDYTEAEAKKISKLIEKMNKCAPGKLNAARRELYGNFLTQTLGSVGQSTGAAGTASVLEAVSGLGGSGDVKNMLPSLGQMAGQVLDK